MNNGDKQTGKSLNKVVEFNEEKVRDYLDQLTVKAVQGALNQLLDVEAEAIREL